MGSDSLMSFADAHGPSSIAIYTSRNPLPIKELRNRYFRCTGVQ